MLSRIELDRWFRAALALAAFAAALAPSPAQAQGAGRAPDEGPHFAIRAYYLGDSFSFSEAALGVDTFTTVDYRGKPGGGFDAEYFLSPWLGIDFAATQTKIAASEMSQTPVGSFSTSEGNLTLRSYMLGIPGHFFRLQHLDAYIGPTVGLAQLSSSFRPDRSSFAFGALLGLDVPLGSTGLALNGHAGEVTFRFPDQLHNASHLRDNYMYGGGLAFRF